MPEHKAKTPAKPKKKAARKPPEPKERKPRPTKSTLDVTRLVDLRLNHRLTYEEIGRISGVKRQAVHARISHLIPSEQTKDFQANRSDILAHQQMRLLAAGLTDDKLKKISPRDAVVSAGILYDKERLENGQATSITDIRGIMIELDAAEARARCLIPSTAPCATTLDIDADPAE